LEKLGYMKKEGMAREQRKEGKLFQKEIEKREEGMREKRGRYFGMCRRMEKIIDFAT
jgi:hypothetical protein